MKEKFIRQLGNKITKDESSDISLFYFFLLWFSLSERQVESEAVRNI